MFAVTRLITCTLMELTVCSTLTEYQASVVNPNKRFTGKRMSTRAITHTLSITLMVLLLWAVPSLQAQHEDKHVSLPQDWSSHHVIFTKKLTMEDLERARNNPRFYHSWLLQGHAYGNQFDRQDSERRSHRHRDDDEDDDHRQSIFRRHHHESERDWSFSLGSGTLARGMYPAKFNFNINSPVTAANCTSDFVVYGLNVAGVSGGQANLVVLQNLYSGSGPAGLCGANPTVKWAYDVSTLATPGNVVSSPVLSLDGTKVAFIESNGTNSRLHVLRFRTAGSEGSVTTSVLPATSTTSGTTWNTCLAGTTSCMFNVTIAGSVTRSSPYYDYKSDVIYQANDNGRIFKITGVFNGTPTLATTGGWASAGVTITGATGTIMTSPVLDDVSGYIFLGSSNGNAYAVLSSAPATQSSMTVGSGSGTNAGGVIFDGPVVDSTNKTVFFAAASNAAGVGNTTANTAAVLVQATTSPTLFGSKVVAILGRGMSGSTATTVNYVHSGAFDQAYYNWTGTGDNAGHYLVCGTVSGAFNSDLYAVPFATGTSGATINPGTHTNNTDTPSANLIASPANVVQHDDCTPVTEIYNGTNDRVFVGTGLSGSSSVVAMIQGRGTNGAFLNTDITNAANIITIAEPAAQGGVSGIVVDNISPQAQAASVYFATLATSNNCGTATFCAVKVTQAGLQ